MRLGGDRDDALMQACVDVTTADGHNHGARGDFSGEHSGKRRGPGALGRHTSATRERGNGGGDFGLGHRHDIVDERRGESEGECADARDRQAVGESGGECGGRGAAVEVGGDETSGVGRLDGDDAHVGAEGFHDGDDTSEEATATDGNDERIEVRRLFEDLERECALAGDDVEIVERMDGRGAGGHGECNGVRLRGLKGFTVEHHVGAKAAAARDLHSRRGGGHDDSDSDAELRAVVSEAEGVVAGRGGDNTAGALLGVETEEGMARAALFEGTRALEVVAFQPEFHAGNFRECRCNEARRESKPGREATAGGFYVSEAEGRSGGGVHGRKNKKP